MTNHGNVLSMDKNLPVKISLMNILRLPGIMYDDLEDKGKETPKEPDDLSYSKHSGYTPGVSSGDVQAISLILRAKTGFKVSLQNKYCPSFL
jgi:hypothetical protein